MEPAWAVTLAVLAAALPALLLVFIIYSYSRRLWRKYFVKEPEPVPIDRRDAALKRSALMASLWRSSIPLRAFQWSEHPSHVITALEHGWPAFAFSYATSAMGAFAGPVHQMWEMCGSCSAMKFCAPEITWTSLSSEECMQQIRLNPGVRSNKDGCVLPVQALQTALPLPGPVLGPCPYPQESYFELLVLASGNELISEHSSLAGNERVKLIAQTLTSDRYQRGQSFGGFNDTEFCRKVNSPLNSNADVEYDKNGISSNSVLTGSENEQDGDNHGHLGDESMLQKVEHIDWDELLSVGLAGADAPPFRLLGFDPGSVGFLSADGQCYVNGQLNSILFLSQLPFRFCYSSYWHVVHHKYSRTNYMSSFADVSYLKTDLDTTSFVDFANMEV